jgi:hypothetical protein
MVGINHPVSRTIQIKQGVLPKTRLKTVMVSIYQNVPDPSTLYLS